MAKISVIVSEEVKRALEERASAEDRNISWIIRKAAERYLEETKEKE